ncbi:MAG: hypothetical protein OJK14_16020, partial [Achromobacter sp.]|nr:hypothetical protein [Achromobacter sp.]
MSTSETRVRSRRAGNTTAAKKAPAARKATTAKKDAARLSAKSPARAMVPAKTRSKSAVAKPVARKAVSKA